MLVPHVRFAPKTLFYNQNIILCHISDPHDTLASGWPTCQLSSAQDEIFFRRNSKGCENGVRTYDFMVIGSPYHWASASALLLCELVFLCTMLWGADSVQSARKWESNLPCVRSHCLEVSRTHLSVLVALKVIRPTYQF
jgi:hypothetical protein